MPSSRSLTIRGRNTPFPTADCKQSIRPEVAAGVTYALKQVLTKGSGYNIPVNKNSYDVFAKTGTTDGNTQTWVVGGTSGVVTASWFGNYQGYGADWFNQNVTINGRFWPNVDGADLAGTQWANLMNAAAPQFSTAPFPQPPASMIGAPVTDNSRPAFDAVEQWQYRTTATGMAITGTTRAPESNGNGNG